MMRDTGRDWRVGLTLRAITHRPRNKYPGAQVEMLAGLREMAIAAISSLLVKPLRFGGALHVESFANAYKSNLIRLLSNYSTRE